MLKVWVRKRRAELDDSVELVAVSSGDDSNGGWVERAKAQRRPAEDLKAGKKGKKSTPVSSSEQRAKLVAQINDTVTAVMGTSVGAEEPLMDAGIDSLGAVELRNSLATAVGADLPGTLVFDYPSISSLCGFLETQL